MANLLDKVNLLLEEFFAERTDLYPVKISVSPANAIHVIIDGDKGVSLQDCLDTSRKIENNLDREEQDFSLEVASPGATEPMVMPRQYRKNIGREITVQMLDGSEKTGELRELKEDGISLFMVYRKPKEIGKGKMTVEEEVFIPFAEIKSSTVVLKF